MKPLLLRGSFQTSVDASGDGPKWNVLFPRGTWHGENLRSIGGSLTIDDDFLGEVVANWNAAGRPPLPIRKTHQHLDPDVKPLERLELEAAYGLLTDLRVTVAGLEVLADWNDAGRAEVKSGAFNFWSPEWTPTHVDRRTGERRGWWLQGTALTNDPFFNSMPRVAASVAAAPTHQPNKEHTMKPELLKRLKAALKMPEDTSDEDLVASCEKATASYVAASAATAELETKLTASLTAAVTPLQAQLKAATEKVIVLEAEANSAKAALLDRDVDALMTSAKLEGKAVEPMREFVVSAAKRDGIEAAKKLVAALPVTVPLKELGLKGDGEKPTADALQASIKEYTTKLDAYAKANNLTTHQAARTFNRDNAELVKRAFAVTP